MKEMGQRIRDAAELAMGHYANMLDSNIHQIPYFFARLDSVESVASHSEWDFGDATGRYLDALIACRKLTGNTKYLEAEEKLKDSLRWMTGDDGLSYRMLDTSWVSSCANMFDQRSVMLGLLRWAKDGSDEAAARFNKLVHGLYGIVTKTEKGYCFPFENYKPGMSAPDKIFTPYGFVVDPAHYGGGVMILPLALWAKETGDECAYELARGLYRFLRRESRAYEDDGSFYSKARYPDDGHFHSKMGAVAGVLRLAELDFDRDAVDWCSGVYDWARAMGSSTGWFPEGTGVGPNEPVKEEYTWLRGTIKHSEICCATDMLHCALVMSRLGYRDLWSHAIGYANHLLESQITDVSFAITVDRPDEDDRTWRDLPARYLGGFVGRNTPNDLTRNGTIDTMGCCCAAGGRGLCLLMENAAERCGEEVRVYFSLSNETPDVSVTSAMPQTGEFSVMMKRDGLLRVRRSDWMRDVYATLNGRETKFGIRGNELDFGSRTAGDTVTLRFPLETNRESTVVASDGYIFDWRGDSVVAAEPKGAFMPLYQK